MNFLMIGLDAFTAGQVIKTLKELSRRGRTIIFSIHQPKYSIYKLFDSLTLVCKGNLVYHGAAGKYAINYFNRLGYRCEEHDNPTDFFMDILHGEASSINSSDQPSQSNSLRIFNLAQFRICLPKNEQTQPYPEHESKHLRGGGNCPAIPDETQMI
ncbi:ATP-binding cassette sub- G member 2 [Cichlidogyrus casuarinus]|uniref:ATP-binding cassette sub- G member 2 n=1 Tax=Cichlidogyrus casuarinus TaxID=1844966 RepID=A0ABD2PQ10_9PLAT